MTDTLVGPVVPGGRTRVGGVRTTWKSGAAVIETEYVAARDPVTPAAVPVKLPADVPLAVALAATSNTLLPPTGIEAERGLNEMP
jgi:hypothetical protein